MGCRTVIWWTDSPTTVAMLNKLKSLWASHRLMDYLWGKMSKTTLSILDQTLWLGIVTFTESYLLSSGIFPWTLPSSGQSLPLGSSSPVEHYGDSSPTLPHVAGVHWHHLEWDLSRNRTTIKIIKAKHEWFSPGVLFIHVSKVQVNKDKRSRIEWDSNMWPPG